MRITRCLPFIFMLCVVGCRSIDTHHTHATVKHALPEVTNAILLSCREDLWSETRTVAMKTNDTPGVSFTLTVYGGRWPVSMTTTEIRATAVNSNESTITVRSDKVSGDVLVFTARDRNVERRSLTAIINMLNQRQ